MTRKYSIVCPHCKKEVLESEPDLDTTVGPNGVMFHVIDGVSVRQKHRRSTHTRGQNFPCPMCMNPLAGLNGHVLLRCRETNIVFRTGNEPPELPGVDRVSEAAAARQAEIDDMIIDDDEDDGQDDDDERNAKIIELRKQGLSYAKIADQVGCSASTVRRVWKESINES